MLNSQGRGLLLYNFFKEQNEYNKKYFTNDWAYIWTNLCK